MLNNVRRSGLVISLAGFAISVNTLPALVSWFSARLGVPIASFGLIFLLQFASYTLCSITVGKLHATRKLPLLGIVIGSLALSSFFLFWIGSIKSFAMLVLIMILVGGAGGLIESIGTTLITSSSGSNRMLYTSQFFYCLGAFLAPLGVGLLLSLDVSLPVIGYMVGLFSLFIGSIVTLLVYQPWRSNREEVVDQSPAEAEVVLTKREAGEVNLLAFAFLFMTMVSYVILESSVANWFAVYVHDVLKQTSANASFTLSLYWMGMGLSRLFFLIIRIKNHPKTLLIHIGMMVVATLALNLPVAKSSGIAPFLAIFLLGVGCGPIWPLLVEYCSIIFAREHLLMYLVGAGSIGALSGPVITASLFSLFGLQRMMALFLAYLVVIFLAAIVTIAMTARHRTKLV
ncbi:MAG: MFS transporter [Sphaerochaetaceae bacterium]